MLDSQILEFQSVIYSLSEGIAIIRLNEPESLNALSLNLRTELMRAIELAENDPEVKVIILTGEGKAFCAGGDVKGMGKRTILESVEKVSSITKVALRIAEIQKPVVSAINGYAMGAGFSLALATDIIIAQKNAKFGLSFSKVGLIPDSGILYFLPKVVGPWKAKEWIFRGAVITAQEAFDYHVVNHIVEEGEALEEAVKLAKELVNGPLQTMMFAKSIIDKTENLDLRGTLQFENYAQSILQQTEDYIEGVQSFKEKRRPIFKGK